MFIKLVEVNEQIKNIEPCRSTDRKTHRNFRHPVRILYCVGVNRTS